MKQSLEAQQTDAEDRYKRIQQELQQEREVARKDIYEKSNEADKLKGQVTNHEQEVKRLKKQIDSLESELKKASSQSHTSSLMVPQKEDAQSTLCIFLFLFI